MNFDFIVNLLFLLLSFILLQALMESNSPNYGPFSLSKGYEDPRYEIYIERQLHDQYKDSLFGNIMKKTPKITNNTSSIFQLLQLTTTLANKNIYFAKSLLQVGHQLFLTDSTSIGNLLDVYQNGISIRETVIEIWQIIANIQF